MRGGGTTTTTVREEMRDPSSRSWVLSACSPGPGEAAAAVVLTDAAVATRKMLPHPCRLNQAGDGQVLALAAT
jgi:hypothetical protein